MMEIYIHMMDVLIANLSVLKIVLNAYLEFVSIALQKQSMIQLLKLAKRKKYNTYSIMIFKISLLKLIIFGFIIKINAFKVA